MSRKESEAVPEGNCPTPQDAGKMITWEDLRQVVSELWGEVLRKYKEDLRSIDQRLASLEHDARQPRPAMEADVQVDKKTRECTKGVATAVQAMHRDIFSANRVNPDPTDSTTLGVKAEHSGLPCRNDILVENGAAAPKSCLSPLDTCSTAVAGGLLPTCKTSTAIRNVFDQSSLWFCLTEETNMRTSAQSALYDSSFWRNNLLAVSSCRTVIETKSGQNLIFDPCGSKGHLRACPFWKRGALLCGEVHVRALEEAAAFFGG